MLDVWHADAKMAAINDMFDLIGGKGDSRMPRSKLATEPLAWKYHVASHLLRIAEVSRKTAHAAAVRHGVMFDHEKEPLCAGTQALVYSGDVIAIIVSAGTPAAKLDTVALFDELVGAGFTRSRLDRMIAKHTHAGRAPHKFTSTLVTG